MGAPHGGELGVKGFSTAAERSVGSEAEGSSIILREASGIPELHSTFADGPRRHRWRLRHA